VSHRHNQVSCPLTNPPMVQPSNLQYNQVASLPPTLHPHHQSYQRTLLHVLHQLSLRNNHTLTRPGNRHKRLPRIPHLNRLPTHRGLPAVFLRLSQASGHLISLP
jgi:hypothetical protein